jgi:hypothetical protein
MKKTETDKQAAALLCASVIHYFACASLLRECAAGPCLRKDKGVEQHRGQLEEVCVVLVIEAVLQCRQ